MNDNDKQVKKEGKKKLFQDFVIAFLGCVLGNCLRDFINIGRYIKNEPGKFIVEVIIIAVGIMIVNILFVILTKIFKK